MLAEADVGASRMAWHDRRRPSRDLVDHFLRGKVDVGEIEPAGDVVVDAENQHVAVVGLDLGGAQHQDAVLVLERAVVGLAG